MHKLLIPVLLMFSCLFIFPADCAAGAKDGLLLWFNTMIPAVFPFILLTNMLRRFGGISLFSRLFGKIIAHIFSCPPGGAYAVIVGFLCGYPTGAKAVCDSLKSGALTVAEARYLLSFCNNPSPMFVINFVIFSCLAQPHLILPFFVIIYISTWLNARFWYIIKYKRLINKSNKAAERKILSPPVAAVSSDINAPITDALALIQKIGVYMIIFSILCRLILKIPIPGAGFFKILLIGLTEQTTGFAALHALPAPDIFKITAAVIFICFGGFAAAAQAIGIIRESLPAGDYVLCKLSHGFLAGIMTFIYVLIF